jgi:hypothetical protein
MPTPNSQRHRVNVDLGKRHSRLLDKLRGLIHVKGVMVGPASVSQTIRQLIEEAAIKFKIDGIAEEKKDGPSILEQWIARNSQPPS